MIELKNYSTGYHGNAFVKLEQACFKPGEITALMGRNGSGKSTLLKSMVGILSHQGSMSIDTLPAESMKPKERAKRIAYLAQNLTNPDMDVETLVSHGRFPFAGYSNVLNDTDLNEIHDAMEMADVMDLKDRSVQSLSGGERQRVYLAMIIAQNTDYVMLDEPNTYLDVEHQLKVIEILKNLADMGKGIIVASHDLPQTFTISDQIILLNHGRISAVGTPSELAQKKDLLQDAMGVSIISSDDPNALYAYQLEKKI
ncbi:MAG: ABC transporter ATP-binding protein [Solobacterium sp.]|jgi:iron complex transport system ATP-binding protein|nr:ABC transporter ATP-binding protein [Solobacterium sp.]MCH4222033.1 ABC transporter ATP-binding protein [Solobacterium sp.]MCH4265695.1 ABC transporter ATP-binding protein [Solobacterium sp.]